MSKINKLGKKLIKVYQNSSSRFKYISIGLALILLGFSAYRLHHLKESDSAANKTKNITIHYIGHYSSKQKPQLNFSNILYEFAKLHEIVLKKHLFNNLSTNKKVSYKFKVHNNHSDPLESRKIYEEILDQKGDNEEFLIVDNTWGAELKACQSLIKKENIPVIAINADHNQRDFGENAVFIGNDDVTPKKLTMFLSKVLKSKEVNFISETDYELHSEYISQFDSNEIRINRLIQISRNEGVISDKDSIEIISQFEKNLSKETETILVLNVHSVWGMFILKLINAKYSNITVLSPGYSTTSWYKSLSPKRGNTFLTVAPSEGAVSKKIKKQVEFFRSSKDSLFFSRINIHEYIADCNTVIDIAKDYLENLTNNIERSYKLKLLTDGIKTDHHLYLFNDNRATELDRAHLFSTFRNGILEAYPIQLNKRNETIPNVFFGMEIESIYNLNLQTGRYGVDFYYWIKFDKSYSKVEKLVDFFNINVQSKTELLSKEIPNTNFVYKLYKVSAICSQEFDLEAYPIDEHEIKLSAQIIDPTEEVMISFDQESLDSASFLHENINLKNWVPTSYMVTVDNSVLNSSSKGLTKSKNTKQNKSISIWINIKRESYIPILGLILPLLIIGFIGIGILFIKDRSFEHVGDTTASLLITTVLFSISLAQFTPASAVLKKTDWIFWLTLIVVLTNFTIMVFESSIFFKKKMKKIKLSIIVGYLLAVTYPICVIYLLMK